jgi:hypothetical protein
MKNAKVEEIHINGHQVVILKQKNGKHDKLIIPHLEKK